MSSCKVQLFPEAQQLTPFSATIRQLTLGGGFVETTHPCPVGTRLRFKLTPRQGPVIRGHAQVVRSVAGRGASCIFVDLPSFSRHHLTALLRDMGGLTGRTGAIVRLDTG